MSRGIAIAGVMLLGCGEKHASSPPPPTAQAPVAAAVEPAPKPRLKVDSHDLVIGGTAWAMSVAITAAHDVVMTVAVHGVAQIAGKPYGSAVGDGETILLMSVAAGGDHAVHWVTQLAKTKTEAVLGRGTWRVALGRADAIVVAGEFEGSVDLGGGRLTSAGDADLALAKYTAGGAHVWSHRFGGVGPDNLAALAVDGQDRIVVAGAFAHALDFGGGKRVAGADDADLFVARFAPAGEVVSATALSGGGSDTSALRGLAIDAHDAAIVLGAVAHRLDAGGAPLVVEAGKSGGFLAAVAPDGTLAWSTLYAGYEHTDPEAVAIGAGGALVVAGSDIDRTMTAPDKDAHGMTGPIAGTMTGFVDSLAADHTQAWRLTLGDLGIGTAETFAIGADGEVNVVAAAFQPLDPTAPKGPHVVYARVSPTGRPDGAIELPGARPSAFGTGGPGLAARGADLAIVMPTEHALTLFTPAK